MVVLPYIRATDIANPGAVNAIGLILPEPLPSDEHAAALYFTLPPYQTSQFIGAVANERPR